MLETALKQIIEEYLIQNKIELTPSQVLHVLQGVVYATQLTINDSISDGVSLELETSGVSNDHTEVPPNTNQPKKAVHPKIEIVTPKGLICGTSVDEDHYPGLNVSINGENLVAVEYDADRNQHVIRVWKQDQEEPAYVQSVEDYWIKTDEFQYVRVDGPTVFTVIGIAVIPPEIAEHLNELYILRMMQVDLEEYSTQQITDTLKFYGYELMPFTREVVQENTLDAIASTQMDNNQIIAECIAETYIATESQLTLRFKDKKELAQYLQTNQIDLSV